MSKDTDKFYVNKIIKHITMTSMAHPRKKSSLMTYVDLNKESIKATFDLL